MVLDFNVDVLKEQDVPIVRVNGEIDVYTCPKLRKVLREVIDEKARVLVLNLEKVKYIDSTGLGAIAQSANVLDKDGGKLNVVCTKPQVKRIFDVSGLSKKNIKIFEEEGSALANLDN